MAGVDDAAAAISLLDEHWNDARRYVPDRRADEFDKQHDAAVAAVHKVIDDGHAERREAAGAWMGERSIVDYMLTRLPDDELLMLLADAGCPPLLAKRIGEKLKIDAAEAG